MEGVVSNKLGCNRPAQLHSTQVAAADMHACIIYLKLINKRASTYGT